MSDAEINIKKYTYSSDAFQLLVKWFLLSTLAFIAVVLFHQLLVASMSYVLGYETRIHFGKVESLPHLTEYWGSNRVLLLYAFPAVLLLTISGLLMAGFWFGPQKVSSWTWFKFWLMVFSLLLATTLMSLSLFSMLAVKGGLFQGFAVVTHWYGMSFFWTMIFVILSIILNFSFGFLSSSVLLYLAPADFMIKEGKRHPQKIVLNAYVYTLLLLYPIAIALSFPRYWSFFSIMFIYACLWLPGLFNISNDSLRKRQARKENLESYSNYLLMGLALALIIVIRILLG